MEFKEIQIQSQTENNDDCEYVKKYLYENSLLKKYNSINEELNTLFDVIDTPNNNSSKTIKYLYEGYYSCPNSETFKIPQSEFEYFLLINKKTKKMQLTTNFIKAINFMNLTNDQVNYLHSYVLELKNKEEKLRNELNANGITLYNCYYRKITLLNVHFSTFYNTLLEL